MKEVIDMAVWKFKGCPRCQGDMFLERDEDSWYEECLQCSYRHELKSMSEFKERVAQEEKEPALPGGTRL